MNLETKRRCRMARLKFLKFINIARQQNPIQDWRYIISSSKFTCKKNRKIPQYYVGKSKFIKNTPSHSPIMQEKVTSRKHINSFISLAFTQLSFLLIFTKITTKLILLYGSTSIAISITKDNPPWRLKHVNGWLQLFKMHVSSMSKKHNICRCKGW